ncbi:MAG: hypothetical protein ACKPKO_49405, partial [Candidatus Fonsibacter sp.]
MDTWALIGIGVTMAVVQVALFEVVRRRQKLVLDELFQATKNDRPSISRSAVEAALATIWQRTCLRRISIMAPMVGVASLRKESNAEDSGILPQSRPP